MKPSSSSGGSRANALWGRGGRQGSRGRMRPAFVSIAVLATTAALVLPAAGVAGSGKPGLSGAALSPSSSAALPHFGGATGPTMSSALMKRVQSHPNQVFKFIVLGSKGAKSNTLAKVIGNGYGHTVQKYTSIPAVTATISGAQLQRLALTYPKLLQSITLDKPVKTADYQDAQMWTSTSDISPLWSNVDPNTGADLGPAPQAPAIAFIDSGVNAADTTDFGSRVVASVSFCSLCTDTTSAGTSTAAAPVSSSATPTTDPTATPTTDPTATPTTDPTATPTTDPTATPTTDPTTAPALTDPAPALAPLTDPGTALASDLEGHGTMVAGIAAGAGPDYPGVAQNAPIVSVRVANGNGESMESDVIAACDWILANKDTYGIKVVNISMAGTSPATFQSDPLDQAVERLWFAGVTVVAAAGNFGTGSAVDMSAAPGNDPFIITVGAVDQNQTSDPSDDSIAPWSAFGFTADGFSKPDVAAPGRYMIMPVPMGTTIPNAVPDRVVAPGYMWMSGTSFAAPVVSGAAAQILARHPDWTPDQVKGALMLTAAPVGSADWQAAGVGEIDAATAASLDFTPPNPNENLDAFVSTDPTTGQPVFNSAAWASAVSTDAAWSSAAWSSAAWASAAWASAAWASAAWSSAAWASGVNSAMTSLATYTEATYTP